MSDDNGRLWRTSREGKAKLNAYLDDYAFVISGLLALHDATKEARWLTEAERLQAKQDEMFEAKETGGYYFTSHDHEELIVRTRNANDGVIPSGNSVSVRNLVKLAKLTGKKAYRERAASTLGVFAEQLRSSNGEMANMGLALSEYLDAGQTSPSKLSREGLQPTSYQAPVQQSRQKSQTPPKKPAKKKPVEAKAFMSVDKLPAGNKAKVAIYVRIKKGWHINADKPSPSYLYPTTFEVKSKYGTKLTQVKYPAFKKKRVEGEKDPFHLLEGTVVIYGLIDIPKAAVGKTEELQLILKYQSCDDKTGMCMRPDKIVLGGKVPVVDIASVKQINKEKFIVSKPKTGTRKR